MSGKLKRSRARASVRGRRTPAQPQQASRGSGVPRAVFISLLGIGVVVALVAFLIWQQTRPGGGDFGEFAAIEGDPAPDLQGEFVDLQTIYGGTYGAQGGNTTAPHVTRDVDYASDCAEGAENICNTNPPAGGPHWGSTACADTADASPAFCGPPQWGIYRDPWPPEPMPHAMEHGGVVVWYNTADQTIIDDLETLVEIGRAHV